MANQREIVSDDSMLSVLPQRSAFLQFHKPSIDEDEIGEVVDTLRSGWLTMGPKTLRFEEQFAGYIGAKHALAVNSCTAALHLALDAIGVGAGDEVITCTFTFAATAAVILHCGAKPVLVDCLPDTLTIDPEQVEAAITPRTKAIIPVHFAGHPCEMAAILEIARRHKLVVVEDAAHALPAAYRGRRIGTLGDLTAFSFYAIKNITTGEGGMVTTDRQDYAERIGQRRLHGINRDAWKRYADQGSWRYEISYPGFKYNMTDLNASLGIHQLRKCDRFHRARNRCAALYLEGLSQLAEITLPTTRPEVEHAWHLFPIRLNLESMTVGRDGFIELLRQEKIGTSVHFIPLHLHPYYRQVFGYQPQDFPHSLAAFEQIISLPIYPDMSEEDMRDVVQAVTKIVKTHAVRRRTGRG
ncbi:spore coat protein [Candidatus Methylomirabilis lanthanidiphila]|uniref:Spore coat protein n=1 Tax=Candidatus Methylomirabilis lanthanidiphila TaxID=2211376 RepID=A0A564ZIC6_9BACT|nr:spore coat protein [Candidatus Methylomirabilis lanthanidiphila]